MTLGSIQQFQSYDTTFWINVLDTSPVAMFILEDVNSTLMIRYINRATQRLMGYDLEEVTGKSVNHLAVDNPNHPQGSLSYRLQRLDSNNTLRFHAVHKDGTSFINEIGISQMPDSDDKVTRYVATFHHIANAIQSPKIFDEVDFLDNLLDAVVITDSDFNIFAWNKASERLYGWTWEDVVGKPLIDVIGTIFDSVEQRAQSIEELFSKGFWRGDVIQHNRDRKPIHIRTAVNVAKREDNSVAYIVAINRDMSTYHSIQQKLEETERKRVEVEALQELIEIREQFTSMVSHELRNPLTTIMTSVEMVKNYRDRLTIERQDYHLDKILDQCKYMTDLMNDILVYSKAEAEKLNINVEPIDIVLFMQDLITSLQHNEKYSHQIVFEYDIAYESIVTDKKMFKQIIENLLTNAMKYSPKKSEIQLTITTPDEETIHSIIKDHGIGIPDGDIDILFDPFFRSQNVGNIGGTGLGLAIVKKHVEALGGTISVTSVLGEGTTIELRLPRIIE